VADEQSKADGEEQEAAAQPTRKRRRRWPYVLAVCALAIVLLIALLPRILSLGAARRLILSRVNSRLDGSVEMASWSLRWFSGLGFEGVKLKDADGRTVLEVQAVHVSASVPMLLGSMKDLGTVEIVSPSFDLVCGGPGAAVPSPGGPPGARSPGKEPPALRVPLPFDLKARLLVRDGSGSLRFADAGPLHVRDFKADVRIDGLHQPIRYEAEAAAGEGGGRLKLTGSATVAKDGVVSPDHLDASSEVSVSGFDLSDVSPIARQLGMPADVGGLVDGRLTVEVQGIGAAASGEVHVRNLVLAGGPLGTDRPEIAKVDASFDLEVSADGATVRELQIASPVARADLSGTLSLQPQGTLPRGSLRASGSVDLAPLARLLPNTLRLREGLVIEGGTCALQAQVDSDGETTRLAADFRLAELVATTDGREIRPQAPLAARLVAEIGPAGPRVELIELDSSFATAKASGTLDRFALDASVHLAAAMAEVASFVDVGQWQMSGAVEAHLAIGPGEPARAAERLIEGALTAGDLRIARAEAVLLSEDALSATASVLATLDERRILRQLADLRADVRGSFGEASMSISRIANMDALDALVVSGMEVTGRADLGRLSALVRSLGLAPPGIDAQGSATVALAGALGKGTLRLTRLNAEAKGLTLTSGERVLFASDVKAEGAGQADLAARRLWVGRAVLDAAPVQAGVTDLVVADWSRLPAGLTGRFSASLDLAGVPPLVGHAIDDSTGVRIAGTAQLEAEISAAGEADDDQVRAVSARAVLADVAVQGLTQGPIREESATFALSGLIGPHAGESGWVLSDGAGSARSSLFSSDLKLPRVVFGGPGGLEVSGMELTGECELGPLADLAGRLGLLPDGLGVAGSAEIAGAAAFEQRRLDLKGIEGVVRGLALTREGKAIREPEVRMAAELHVDLPRRSVACPSASLKLSSGTIAAKDVTVADWRDLTRDVAGNVSAGLDVAGLLQTAADYVPLPQDVSPTGKLDLEATVARREGGWDANLRAVSDDLTIARPNASDIALGAVELLAQGTGSAAGPTVTFDPLQFSSAFLGVEGRLALGGAPAERRLEAEGSLEVDFNRIGSLLSEMTGWAVELRGRQSRPFRVVADLSGADWRQALRNVQAEAAVALERFAFGGVQAEDVVAESSAGEGRVDTEVTGTVNEGELRLPLALDLTGRPPALAVPPGSQVLTNVKLTDEMANVILARAAPVFMGALTIQGTIGVDCRSFRVPLERGLGQSSAVTAGLSFQEVSFGSAGVLNAVLSLVNLSDRVARVPDQRVEVALRGGRVHQGRLELYVDKYLLLASGSVGLDKSLDYLIEVPITEELVGSGDTYELLGGQTLKVRVTGSLSAPKIDRDTIRENVQSLIRQAAGRLLLKRGLEELFD